MTNLDLTAAYVGLNSVDKVYLGSEVIWSSGPGPVPYEQQYFTVENVGEGSGALGVHYEVQYSMNGGEWQTAEADGHIDFEPGDKVRFKSVAESGQVSMFQNNSYFNFKVYGNIESMEYGDGFTGATAVKNASAFTRYFRNSKGLIDAENLVLPATTLTNYCYSNMFYGCSSLTTAPALPATTLTNNCYSFMFQYCSGLTQAPVLPSTNLAENCYYGMYYNCTSLSSITCLATTIGVNSTRSWVQSVSPTGTFYKNPDMNDWTTGANGIPSGWTVQDYVAPQ